MIFAIKGYEGFTMIFAINASTVHVYTSLHMNGSRKMINNKVRDWEMAGDT